MNYCFSSEVSYPIFSSVVVTVDNGKLTYAYIAAISYSSTIYRFSQLGLWQLSLTFELLRSDSSIQNVIFK